MAPVGVFLVGCDGDRSGGEAEAVLLGELGEV